MLLHDRQWLARELRDARYAPLSRDEQVDLAKRAAKGDRDASSRLVASVLRLVLIFVNRSRCSDKADLWSYLCYGICRRIHGFDPSRGMISTWANLHLRAMRREYVRQHKSLVRGKPAWYGRDDLVGFERATTLPVLSLDGLQAGDSTGRHRVHHADPAAVDPQSAAETRDEFEFLKRGAWRTLDVRSQTVLRLRAEGASLIEAGQAIGVSRARVHQIETAAVEKLRLAVDAR